MTLKPSNRKNRMFVCRLRSEAVQRLKSYEPGVDQKGVISSHSIERTILKKIKYIAFEDGSLTVCFKGGLQNLPYIQKNNGKFVLTVKKQSSPLFDESKIQIKEYEDIGAD